MLRSAIFGNVEGLRSEGRRTRSEGPEADDRRQRMELEFSELRQLDEYKPIPVFRALSGSS